MARITRVAHAQQRYEMVPVLDEAGQPKRTPVMRNGVQSKTKHGRPIFMTVTVADKSQPLENRTCGSCHQEIRVGDPYKHISPKSGPYGGRTLYRCKTCPDWHVWDYSSSLSAQLGQVSHEFSMALDSAESEDDVQGALDEAADAVRDIAEAKREAAQNIEDGFQHATAQSEELATQAEDLDSWADEISGATIPDFPEPEEDDCDECEASGSVACEGEMHGGENCEHCGGTGETECEECQGGGTITPDEPTEEQIDNWRQECHDELSIVDESPV